MSRCCHARPAVGGCLAVLLVVVLAVGAAGPVVASGVASPVGGASASDLGPGGTLAAQESNEAPAASFEYAPAEPEPGEAVRLDAGASSDPDGEIVEYRWDLDGDGQPDTTGGPTRRVAFPAAGEFAVQLTVVDDDGATASTTRTIQVVGDQPPEPRLDVSPAAPAVGEQVTLDPTASSDPDGQLVSWSFDADGDGSFEETFESPTTVRTRYDRAGTYEVALRVTDNDGLTATTTVSLEVASADTATADGPSDGGAPASPTEPGTTAGPVAGGQDGPAGNGGGGGLLPRGGLLVGGLLGVLVLLGGGVALAARTGDARSRPGSHSPWERGAGQGLRVGGAASVVLALLLVGLLVGVPAWLVARRYAGGAAGSTELSVALLQLVAVALLALVLLVGVLLRLAGEQEDARGASPAAGSLGGGALRGLTVGFGFVASVLLTVGLATVLSAGSLPGALTLAAGLVVAAVSVVPLLLAIVLVGLVLG